MAELWLVFFFARRVAKTKFYEKSRSSLNTLDVFDVFWVWSSPALRMPRVLFGAKLNVTSPAKLINLVPRVPSSSLKHSRGKLICRVRAQALDMKLCSLDSAMRPGREAAADMFNSTWRSGCSVLFTFVHIYSGRHYRQWSSSLVVLNSQ